MSDPTGDDLSEARPASAAEIPAAAGPGEKGPVGPAWLERPRGWLDAYRYPPRPHTPQEAQRWSWVVLAALAAAYGFTQWPLPDLLSSHPDYNFYLVQPIIWGGIALLPGYGWLRLEDRPRFSRLLLGIAFLVGVFHVAVLVIAGVIGNFGNSPIAGKLVNYPKNLWYISTLLAGAEMSRAYLYRVWRERSQRLAFLGATVVFFAIALPAAQWTPFDNLQEVFRVVGGRWVPGLALSALCTFLVSFGGAAPSFAYRLAVLAFEWFSPILPDLDWPVLLVLGVLVPFVSAWLVRSIYRDTKEGAERLPAVAEEEAEAEKKRGWWFWTSWVLTIAVVVAGVLFITGFMGFKLVTIDGISMEPAYSRGDVAIVREGVDPGSLQVDDVILYQRGGLPVVHRIVAIDQGEGGLVFTTKGDNVDNTDPTVGEDQIQGKVVFLIPGVGYLNLWLRGR